MRKIVFFGAVAIVLGNAAMAEARDERASRTSTPASQWLSTEELAAKFEAQGYTVRKIERKRNCGEAKLLDKNGMRVEVRFDPSNGAVVHRQDHASRRDRHDRDDRR